MENTDLLPQVEATENSEMDDNGLLFELNYLSALRNKSPRDVLKEYVDLHDEITTSQLKEQFGDDENAFNDALQKYKSGNDLMRKELFEKGIVKEKAALERRFADEFFELNALCPEVDCFEKIPKEVLQGAEETSLLNAYLRFFHDEQIKIQKNNQVLVDNLRAAAGKLDGGGESFDSLLSAFVKGLNS